MWIELESTFRLIVDNLLSTNFPGTCAEAKPCRCQLGVRVLARCAACSSSSGADWAFTLSAGLRGRSVIPAVGGLVLGYAAITAVVSAGVGALVARSGSILTGLTIVGGLYLIWHGSTTAARPSTPTALDGQPTGTDWNTLAQGIGVSGLNPKGLLIFLALLPQFTNPEWRWPVAGQIAILD